MLQYRRSTRVPPLLGPMLPIGDKLGFLCCRATCRAQTSQGQQLPWSSGTGERSTKNPPSVCVLQPSLCPWSMIRKLVWVRWLGAPGEEVGEGGDAHRAVDEEAWSIDAKEPAGESRGAC